MAATKSKKSSSAARKAAAKKTKAKKAAPAKKATKPKPAKKAAKKAPKKPAEPKKDVLPTAEEEARFWSLIEDAWAAQSAEVNAARKALATRDPDGDDEPDTGAIEEALDGVMESLRAAFANEDFPKEELVAMDRVLERKLYDIDRQDIQEVTDGSDDGFLYARGFIVALGKAFYDAVLANPEVAICDAECEEMCYLPAHSHEERFGEWPKTGASISRESCSNRAGWADGGDGDGDDDDD